MNKTNIPWVQNSDGTPGYTWNPITGCSPVSEGCDHCYAAALSRRFGWPWGHPVFHPERLGQPAKIKKPSRVFVCSMSDLWHEGVTDVHRWAIYRAMIAAPWHTYLLLTKRPQNCHLGWVPRNWWLGVTAENQARYDERYQKIYWTVLKARRFVSIEPMLGPVTVSHFAPVPDWIICGPETGPGARPCNPAWSQALADECADRKIPFFDKRLNHIRREFPAERGQE